MRGNCTSFYAVGCSLLLSFSCNDHDTRSPAASDSFAGAAGEVAGLDGTIEAAGGAAGLSRDGAGDGGAREMPTPSGAAGSEGGDAGAPFVPGGEAGGGVTASAGGASGEGGANTGGGAGGATAAGAAGAPPSRTTAEQRALCESICAKEPLTNGFAGAPTAPCLNNENCVERIICHIADFFTTHNEACIAAFTALLTCWDSLPDVAYECGNDGLVAPDGCITEHGKVNAACYH